MNAHTDDELQGRARRARRPLRNRRPALRTVSRIPARTLRQLPTRWKWAFAAAILALTLGPLLLTSLRAESHTASVKAFPVSSPGTPKTRQPQRILRALLAQEAVEKEVSSVVGPGHYRIEDVVVRRGKPRRPMNFDLRATADTPARARDFANALRVAVFNASNRRSERLGAIALMTLSRELSRLIDLRRARSPVTPTQRRLEQEIEELERNIKAPKATFVFGPLAKAPEPRGFVDRVVDVLPGPFPAKPDPMWAAAAGFVLGLSLCLAVLMIRRPQPRRSEAL